MPPSTTIIPLETPITQKQGVITLFFRQAYEQLRQAVLYVSTLGNGYTASGLTAALSSAALQTTTVGGLYRVTYYMRKTVADGVSSSLTFTWHWTENGVPLSDSDAALTTDTTGAVKSGTRLFYCDSSVGITFDVAYASNTQAKMTYEIWVRIEQVN